MGIRARMEGEADYIYIRVCYTITRLASDRSSDVAPAPQGKKVKYFFFFFLLTKQCYMCTFYALFLPLDLNVCQKFIYNRMNY